MYPSYWRFELVIYYMAKFLNISVSYCYIDISQKINNVLEIMLYFFGKKAITYINYVPNSLIVSLRIYLQMYEFMWVA